MTTYTAASFDLADVPQVRAEELYVAMRYLIAEGRGLALLTGLSESDTRQVENVIWAAFPNDANTRLAVALRFRAMLDAFAARRLKDQFLKNGFKTIAAAVKEASGQRLNARFGFRQQAFVTAVRRTRPQRPLDTTEIALAA